jgi:hypothetical protein
MTLKCLNLLEHGRLSSFSTIAADTGKVVFLADPTALNAIGSIIRQGVVKQFERTLGSLLVTLRTAC